MRDPKNTLSFQRSWFRLSHFMEFLTTHRPLNLKGCFMNTQCQFSSVQSLSHVRLFATPCIAARQVSLSITIFQSSLKLTSIIESVMPSIYMAYDEYIHMMNSYSIHRKTALYSCLNASDFVRKAFHRFLAIRNSR